jgi:hypothetical protein
MLWRTISDVTLIGQIVLLVLAIRLFLVRRTRTFALLMWACVCFVIARSSWFTVGFVEGFLFPQSDRAARATAFRWHEYTDLTFEFFFVVLMILVLISLLRQRSAPSTPSV